MSFQNTRAVNVYQLNTENPPFPLTEEEAPKEINEFVLKCLHATKEERFASADKMLAPWDDAMAKASESMMQKAEVSEANRFWKENFGDKLGVEVPSFVKLFCEKFSISEAAGNKLALQADEDGNGTLTFEEFLETFSKYSMKDLAAKYQAEADKEVVQAKDASQGEPADSYHGKGKRLVFTDVRYTSKGTLMGGQKDRIGTLTMEHGQVEARRFEGSSSISVYQFDIQKSRLSDLNPASTSISIVPESGKPRSFTFKNADDCKKFAIAFEATKAWILG